MYVRLCVCPCVVSPSSAVSIRLYALLTVSNKVYILSSTRAYTVSSTRAYTVSILSDACSCNPIVPIHTLGSYLHSYISTPTPTSTHPTINQPIPARKIPHRQGRNSNIRIRLSCIYLYLTSVCVYIYANVYVTLSSAYIDRLLHRSIYTFNRTLYLENNLCAYVRTHAKYVHIRDATN